MKRNYGLNLHQMVRDAIQTAHPDASGLVFANVGGQVQTDGSILPVYLPGKLLNLQIQPLPGQQQLTEKLGFERVELAVYFSLADLDDLPCPIGRYRPEQRGGDALYLPNSQTWWQISGLLNGSAQSGWLCVLATLQSGAPDFSGSNWWSADFDPNELKS